MDIEVLRNHCLSFPGTEEGFPFDENTLVFYVCKKIFCLVDISEMDYINLKCDPELAVSLREKYPGVTPGYHMNKKHWNSVAIDYSIPSPLILAWIGHSYRSVAAGLTKTQQAALMNAEGYPEITPDGDSSF